MLNEDLIAETYHLLSPMAPRVRWAARRGDALEGSWAGSPLELVEFARAYADWDFYVQPNPSDKAYGKRCSTADILEWRWFLVDLDPAPHFTTTPDSWFLAVEEIIAAMNSYSGGKYKPYVINSGRGRQLWYQLEGSFRFMMEQESGSPHESLEGKLFQVRRVDLFDEPPISVRKELPLRDAITGAQAYWLRQLSTRLSEPDVTVDPSVSDLPRLMRCPGTVNQKTGKTASFMARGTPCERLAWKLLHYTPAEHLWPASNRTPGAIPDGAPWQVAAAYLTKAALDFITLGATEPGRHRACAGAAFSLAEAGLSEAEVLKALMLGAKKCRPEIEDVSYLERTAFEAVQKMS